MQSPPPSKLVLAVDTCGPIGSVALGQLNAGAIEILAEKELEGRAYSEKLITAIADLLTTTGTTLSQLAAIVAVNGPGSFTGVRLGLSAIKGLAEPTQIPVVVVSRLAVLAAKGNCTAAALDAHRHEVFLRLEKIELLAGAEELAMTSPAHSIAVCDEPAAARLAEAWPNAQLVMTPAPTAADALELCASRVEAHDFTDLALLDGHYLRRSDAEIFGSALKIA